MKRPQDSDIFGTKSTTFAPRIRNDSKVDPNAEFQARMDAQYEAYARKIGSSHRGAFDPKVLTAKVNEEANFDEHYHHSRKDADLQSTIFYEPTPSCSRMGERPKITERHVPKHAYSAEQGEQNWGKKQTLGREVREMPENTTHFKGNSSNIFGYDEHTDRNEVKNKVSKLIPSQMQWTEHDSVRHQDARIGVQANSNSKQTSKQFDQISQSQSQVFTGQDAGKKIKQVNVKTEEMNENNSLVGNMKKNKQVDFQEKRKKLPKKAEQTSGKDVRAEEKVEIAVLKGWSSNIMEDLSKWCRVNGTKIASVNFEDGGKGILVLQRKGRWENITDWLRKDAKLKIRVN